MKFEQQKYLNNLLNYYISKYPDKNFDFIYKIIYEKHLVGHSFILNINPKYNKKFEEIFLIGTNVKEPHKTNILSNCRTKSTRCYSFIAIFNHLYEELWLIISIKRRLLIEEFKDG